MPVTKVSGGYKIKGSYRGQQKLIGTDGGKPFTSQVEAERVSAIRESYRTPHKKWKQQKRRTQSNNGV